MTNGYHRGWCISLLCRALGKQQPGIWGLICLWVSLSLDCKEIQPVHPKGNQCWMFTGRTDAEAETPVLWPPDAKNWLIGKDPDAGKDWGQEERGKTEDEMVGWNHRFVDMSLSKLRELVMDRVVWRSAICGVAELDTTEGVNWTELWSQKDKKRHLRTNGLSLWLTKIMNECKGHWKCLAC